MASLAVASAILAVPVWLGLRNIGASWAWTPLLLPGVIFLLLLAVEAVVVLRKSRERIVIDVARRQIELRHIIVNGYLFGPAVSRSVSFANINSVHATYRGHAGPGVKISLIDAAGRIEELEFMDDRCDRGSVSEILQDYLREERERRGEVWA